MVKVPHAACAPSQPLHSCLTPSNLSSQVLDCSLAVDPRLPGVINQYPDWCRLNLKGRHRHEHVGLIHFVFAALLVFPPPSQFFFVSSLVFFLLYLCHIPRANCFVSNSAGALYTSMYERMRQHKTVFVSCVLKHKLRHFVLGRLRSSCYRVSFDETSLDVHSKCTADTSPNYGGFTYVQA